MRHIVLASHHQFAYGLADTLEFLGVKDPIHVICAYMDETPLGDQIGEVFAEIPEGSEVLVLTDILAGSVNQAFMPHLRPGVFIVAGVNVVLAMELCLMAGELDEGRIEEAIAMAGSSIRLINTLEIEDGEDDE